MTEEQLQQYFQKELETWAAADKGLKEYSFIELITHQQSLDYQMHRLADCRTHFNQPERTQEQIAQAVVVFSAVNRSDGMRAWKDGMKPTLPNLNKVFDFLEEEGHFVAAAFKKEIEHRRTIVYLKQYRERFEKYEKHFEGNNLGIPACRLADIYTQIWMDRNWVKAPETR